MDGWLHKNIDNLVSEVTQIQFNLAPVVIFTQSAVDERTAAMVNLRRAGISVLNGTCDTQTELSTVTHYEKVFIQTVSNMLEKKNIN